MSDSDSNEKKVAGDLIRNYKAKDIGINADYSLEEHVPAWAKVGFIGAGNMAQAIATSLIRTGICIPAQILASAPSDRFKHHWPIPMDFSNDNKKVVHECEYIFLGMKPQYLDSAIEGLVKSKVFLNNTKAIISMLVGIDLKTLRKKLAPLIPDPNNSPSIFRIMPNTAMKYGQGVTGFCRDDKYVEEHYRMSVKLLEQGGIVENIPENLMNSFGAISGSGPAYLFLVMDAMADGAVKQGIPRDMALRIGAQILKGSGQLIIKDMLRLDHPSQAHPAVHKDAICSPGGSSIAGIHELEKAGVRSAFMNAIEAARKRSDEIGRLAAEKD